MYIVDPERRGNDMKRFLLLALSLILAVGLIFTTGSPVLAEDPPPTGTVWAWGYNGWGQLGNNTLINSKIPVPVAGLSGVIAIAGGHGHSLALQGAAPPPVTESKFIYSIKFLCGRGSESFGVKPANYATAINIHNFHDETVTLKKKVVIAHREGEPPGEVTPYTDNVSLGSNIAIEVDCVDICELLGEEDPATGRCMRFLKGFVVIESSQPLNIVAVYTSSTGGWFGGGFSMDIEYISPVVSP
jgi:hypothetical protein